MAVKVEIQNETAWQTKMLRPFLVRVANDEFPGTKPSNTRTKVVVQIQYTRGGGRGCSGYARYHSRFAVVRVPAPWHGAFPVIDFCHVAGHEFGHCKGITHQQMGLHYRRGAYSDQHYAWALQLPRPQAVPKRKAPSTDEKRAKALQAAQQAVKRWQTKSKLAQTKLTYWARRVKALERRIQTAAPQVYTPDQEGGSEWTNSVTAASPG